MFLKSLEIFGFKSFADRTQIQFADGITALLGPNGCGKSNVVDAIKWVLAENKSKNLRASSMEDVIFNGTESRPALSMAEVTLTIANEKGLLPMSDSEIAIKRRLYRSGENEYFINNRQCTATEIRRLFMDTGVGKAAYSVMEQGKIDQILSSKPEDRRYLFEEAAGISRSKAEVAEAERELEKTRANLAQIDISLQETKRNYDTLKVQSDKTVKHRKLQDAKFNYELDIQLLRLKDFTQNKARHEQARLEAEQKRDAAIQEIQAIYNSLNENTDRIRELQEQVAAKEQTQIKLITEQSGKKTLASQLRQQQSSIKEKIYQIEGRIKALSEQIDESTEEIDNQKAELRDKEKQVKDIEQNIESFAENIRQASLQIEENERLINTNSGKIRNLDAERAELQKQLASITEDIVTELDAKLKNAGYSSSSNRSAKEELDTQLEKIRIFVTGRANIFSDYSSLPSPSSKDAQKFSGDALQAFKDLGSMLEGLSTCIDKYTKTTPQFIDDFLSPEGIITKKRAIDEAIEANYTQIDNIKKESAELDKLNTELNKKIVELKDTLSNLHVNRATVVQQINTCNQQISTLQRTLAVQENSKRDQENELFQENRRREEMDEQLQEIEESIADIELECRRLADELKGLDVQIAECNSKNNGKEAALKKKQEERNKYQSQLERYTVDIAQNETEIRSVKQNFQDNYSRNLMEFEERMYTITETTESLRKKLAETKQKLNELGPVNLMAVEQFQEEKERYERQVESYNDAQKTLQNLVKVSEEIRSKSAEMFVTTYNRIRKNFHNMFRRLFVDNEGHGGGKADLRLVDPTNVLTSGIEILAQPPGKKLQSISLLSGGEKTMTAVALLFATYQVRPSPFCLLDEIDAALDNKNVTSFISTLRTFANVSQYIVITHNTKTAVGASTMIGVTMEESGISKVVQMRKDEDTLNARLSYDNDDNFVEEDVEPEEGIVIPPRPQRRKHNPDGTLAEEEKVVDAKTISEENISDASPEAENAVAPVQGPQTEDSAQSDSAESAVTDAAAGEEAVQPSAGTEEFTENPDSAEDKGKDKQ